MRGLSSQCVEIVPERLKSLLRDEITLPYPQLLIFYRVLYCTIIEYITYYRFSIHLVINIAIRKCNGGREGRRQNIFDPIFFAILLYWFVMYILQNLMNCIMLTCCLWYGVFGIGEGMFGIYDGVFGFWLLDCMTWATF